VNIELLPGLTNVVRFPIELRAAPSMEVLYEIEPDSREVSLIAESYMLELPEPELFDLMDQETALYIADHILPLAPAEQKAALAELLDPVVTLAVAACRDADRTSKQLVKAEELLLRAKTEGGYTMQPLEENTNALSQRAAELLILAHRRCTEAHGVNRAVGMARRGETWTRYSAAETAEWLIAAGEAARAEREARTA
jgi:hypothetical protein